MNNLNKDKPVIFLDIDDVLTTTKEYNVPRHKVWEKYNKAKELNVPYVYNTGCVKVLNDIIKETDCQIVLTSDWRLRWNIEEMGRIFEMNGIIRKPDDFTDYEPISLGNIVRNRAHEINKYITENNIVNYVVVDYYPLGNDLPVGKFILTKEKEGIKQSGIKSKILKVLSTEENI